MSRYLTKPLFMCSYVRTKLCLATEQLRSKALNTIAIIRPQQ